MLHIKAWFQTQYAPIAPRIDLQLLKDIRNCKVHNSAMADNAIQISGHLSYLSEELVPFVFFDDGISVATERQMVAALHKTGLRE